MIAIAPPKAAPIAERHARDLVLGLESVDREILEGREIMQNVAGRSDRIGAQKQWASALHRRGDKAQRRGGVAGDVAVETRGDVAAGFTS